MKGLSAEKQRDLILSVGIHKQERPLSPLEVAQLIDIAIKSGNTKQGLSEEILLSPDMIDRFLRLLRLSEDIQYLVGWGGKSRISFSTASEFARLQSLEEQEILAEKTLEHKLSKSEVMQVIETKNKFNKTINESVQAILDMRPQVVKRYLFVGAIRSSELQNKLSTMSQRERDILFNNIIGINFPAVSNWEGLLGTTRFTVIGNEDLEQALNKPGTDFSLTINNYLELNAKSNE